MQVSISLIFVPIVLKEEFIIILHTTNEIIVILNTYLMICFIKIDSSLNEPMLGWMLLRLF